MIDSLQSDVAGSGMGPPETGRLHERLKAVFPKADDKDLAHLEEAIERVSGKAATLLMLEMGMPSMNEADMFITYRDLQNAFADDLASAIGESLHGIAAWVRGPSEDQIQG